jgi:hypothetical protein
MVPGMEELSAVAGRGGETIRSLRCEGKPFRMRDPRPRRPFCQAQGRLRELSAECRR